MRRCAVRRRSVRRGSCAGAAVVTLRLPEGKTLAPGRLYAYDLQLARQGRPTATLASLLSFAELVLPRAPDGRKLYAALRPPAPESGGLPPGMPIAPADAARVSIVTLHRSQMRGGVRKKRSAQGPRRSAHGLTHSSRSGRHSEKSATIRNEPWPSVSGA